MNGRAFRSVHLSLNRDEKRDAGMTDEIIDHRADFRRRPGPPPGGRRPHGRRMDVYLLLGLKEGDAHVIRNAGGVITKDERRSPAISQRMLDTREIHLIHHTQCGMPTFTDDEFKDRIERETGIRPDGASEAFTDPEADVRRSIRRIRGGPFIPFEDRVRGFDYEVETGRLREVACD
ncbi:beta-class carbonic anhydrase [Nocardiopsis mangrovi]|uniref:carbonic anhydrase n=1 Tax=Nocardiopsis mangrovi TaxID=1179818 RepID=A0ABV9DQ41_9ACTN